MTALYILGGAALAVPSWIWLWLRIAGQHWTWGVAGVLPPAALLGGLLNARAALLPLLVHIAGLGVLGFGLWQLWQEQPEQLERLVKGQWSEQVVALESDGHLQGQLQGQPFVLERAELQQGMLVLRQGQGLIANREIRIDLSGHGRALMASVFGTDVLPDDKGELPQVELLWQEQLTGQPRALRVSRSYTLSLSLERVPNGLVGKLYLSLPAHQATVVSGSFFISTADEQPDPEWLQPDENIEVEVQTEPEVVPVPVFSLSRLRTRPHEYLQRELYIETASGHRVRGKFQGINEAGQLEIKQMVKSPGFVVFRVAPSDVQTIKLQQP